MGKASEDLGLLKEYINLIRQSKAAVIFITVACVIVALLYAVNAKNIYKSTASIKVNKPRGSILEAPLLLELQELGSDRFIANEIEIIKSYSIAQRVVDQIIDTSLKCIPDSFILIRNNEPISKQKCRLLTGDEIISVLEKVVTIEQRRGLDIIEISAESPSAFEAALIAGIYGNEYRKVNLEINRKHLSIVKDFLAAQKEEKFRALHRAEESLKDYQEQGGILALDLQTSSLINQLSLFEAKKNSTLIELIAAEKVLTELKDELKKQDPRLADYLASLASEAQFKLLQEQIARLEINRDLALSGEGNNFDQARLQSEYQEKINGLKNQLLKKTDLIKAGILAASPEEVKELSKKIIEQEINYLSLHSSLDELTKLVDEYNARFNKLPQTAIELAGYQRDRISAEKLYVLVEEKYQEALINEQSQPGNVLIVDQARATYLPFKPNRFLIIVVGLILGSITSLGYVYLKNSFDTTIKNPEDLKKENVSVLAWIPKIEGLGGKCDSNELIVSNKPDSVTSEAFKALRTRVKYSKGKEFRTLLITSAAPREGKTLISVNLAAAFAQSSIKSLLVDCDLRKPRIHTLFNLAKGPGLADFLAGDTSLEEIVNCSPGTNLDIITSGFIPSNPAEFLESVKMREFLRRVKEKYEIILLDSAPVIPVADTEILAKFSDASLLVVSADTTDISLMKKAAEMLQEQNSEFIGAVLNNFSYKPGYASYYKYYYYYSIPLKKESTTGNLHFKT